MLTADLILHLVSEWPLGPPRYPVRKVVCAVCGKDVWLEVTPEYLLVREYVGWFVPDCALLKLPKVGGP